MKQNSAEWDDFRAVRITASRFGDVLAKPTTKRYRYYMENIIESLLGFPKFPKETPWFDHGKEWEDKARGLYEWEQNVTTTRPAVIIHPKYDFISCSPDGQIGDLTGLEIKCHRVLSQYRESVRVELPSQHKPQVQGSLWIAGWKRLDFISYYQNHNGKNRLLNIHPIYPDKKYHKRLEAACLDFWDKIQERIKRVKGAT